MITCRRGDSGRTPDAEEGARRKVNIDSNRTQTTRVRVGVGVTRRSSRERRRLDTDPDLSDMRTASPEDVATRTGIILRPGAAEAGAKTSGRCHRLIFRRIRRRVFHLICRLDNFPIHRGTLLRQIIPTKTNTWDTRGGGQQRGTGHHHRRRSRELPSSSSSNNSKRARLLPSLPLLLQLSSPAPGAAQASGAPLQVFLARCVKRGKSASVDSVAVGRDGVVRGSVVESVELALITRVVSALRRTPGQPRPHGGEE